MLMVSRPSLAQRVQKTICTSITHSLARSLPPSLPPTLTPSLPPSLAHSSHTHTHTRARAHARTQPPTHSRMHSVFHILSFAYTSLALASTRVADSCRRLVVVRGSYTITICTGWFPVGTTNCPPVCVGSYRWRQASHSGQSGPLDWQPESNRSVKLPRSFRMRITMVRLAKDEEPWGQSGEGATGQRGGGEGVEGREQEGEEEEERGGGGGGGRRLLACGYRIQGSGACCGRSYRRGTIPLTWRGLQTVERN